MFTAWIFFHILVCLALIMVVLLQSSKGEGLAGSAFGGGLSSAVFGGRGAASFLSKATTVLAVVFMVNCGVLAYMSSQTRVATTPTAGETTSESAVTRQAQAEAERAAQQQQQQQQQAPIDTTRQTSPAGGGQTPTGGTQPPQGGK